LWYAEIRSEGVNNKGEGFLFDSSLRYGYPRWAGFLFFSDRFCRYNPFGMLRFRISILTRLSVVSELSGDLLRLVNAAVHSQVSLVAENRFLRKQLAFYQERKARPRRLTDAARLTLVLWFRWFNFKDALIIVKPETLIGWHRKGFRLFWRVKSRRGRPPLPRDICQLIARMARENPTWGQARVADELSLKLGIVLPPPHGAQVLAVGTK
jgi:hypothetical protein